MLRTDFAAYPPVVSESTVMLVLFQVTCSPGVRTCANGVGGVCRERLYHSVCSPARSVGVAAGAGGFVDHLQFHSVGRCVVVVARHPSGDTEPPSLPVRGNSQHQHPVAVVSEIDLFRSSLKSSPFRVR